MKILFAIISIFILISGCLGDNDDAGETRISEPRQKMRELVIEISEFSREIDPDFIIITQNGNELVMSDADADQMWKRLINIM